MSETAAKSEAAAALAKQRVFVSYTHDSKDHCARVRRMVERLRGMGFTVVFDEDQPPGGPDRGWATWSEDEAANAPRVIVVATEAFGKCWLGQHPPGMRDGATWEAACLANRTYLSGARVGFIRVVIFDNADAAHVPMRLRGLTRYHGETGVDGLAAWLRGEREPPRPASPTAPMLAPAAVLPAPRFDIHHPADITNFVGRAAERAEFASLLAHGGGCSLLGDSRIGKSSLLLEWQRMARAAQRAASVVDFQAMPLRLPAFLAAATGGQINVPPHQSLSSDEAAELLEKWANGQPQPPIILLDETEAGIRGFEHRFFERLRALVPRVVFILASRRPLPNVFQEKGHTSPFANLLITWRLGLLEDDAAASLASRAGEHAGLLRHWAGNHPFYLQALGDRLAHSGTVEGALRRFCDTASDRFAEAWQTFGPKARAAMEMAAAGLPVDHRELKNRGWLTAAGRPFGQVLLRWLREKE